MLAGNITPVSRLVMFKHLLRLADRSCRRHILPLPLPLLLRLLAATVTTAGERPATLSLSTFQDADALVVPMERVVSEAYRRLGIRITVQRLPLTRSLADANAGYFDGELGRVLENAKEAPNLLRVPESLGETEYSAYMHRAKADASLASWAALRKSGLRIGARLGARVPDANLGDAITLRSKSQDALLKMLADDRLDVVVGTTITTHARLAAIRQNQPQLADQIVELDPALQIQPFYHFLHQRHAALLAPLSAELRAMRADGSIARIWAEAAREQSAP